LRRRRRGADEWAPDLRARFGYWLGTGEFVQSLVKGALWVAVAGLVAHAYIDNAAHTGGFLAGLGVGLVLVPSKETLPLGDGRFTRGAGLVALAVLVLVAFASAALVLRLI